ncbi:hypothetical protein V6N13_062582 [Hibiscus sabdariffa]|uniref:Uncharacterized protein n=2 Tax=Hibiscus sabdariffa TaxID=183260 RepID=A0ABR2BAW6_9ROSI
MNMVRKGCSRCLELQGNLRNSSLLSYSFHLQWRMRNLFVLTRHALRESKVTKVGTSIALVNILTTGIVSINVLHRRYSRN